MKPQVITLITILFLGSALPSQARTSPDRLILSLRKYGSNYQVPLFQYRFGPTSNESTSPLRYQMSSSLFEDGKKWGSGEWLVIGAVVLAVVVVIAVASSHHSGGGSSGGSGY